MEVDPEFVECHGAGIFHRRRSVFLHQGNYSQDAANACLSLPLIHQLAELADLGSGVFGASQQLRRIVIFFLDAIAAAYLTKMLAQRRSRLLQLATSSNQFLCFEPDSAWAKSWLTWGKEANKPRRGCITVFTRNGGGHVAFYISKTSSGIKVLAGNQSDAVNISTYPASKLLGYRIPG
jgi:hypothetical protein